MPDCVNNQVIDQALKQRFVGFKTQFRDLNILPDGQARSKVLQTRQQFVQNGHNIKGILTAELTVLHLGKQKEIPVQMRETVGHLIEILNDHRLIFSQIRLLEKDVQLASEHCQRGLELVRGILSELLLGAVTLHITGHQTIESRVESGELLGVAVRQRRADSVLQIEGLNRLKGLVERLPKTAGTPDWYRHFGWSAGLTFRWTFSDGGQKRQMERQAQIKRNTVSAYRDNFDYQPQSRKPD